MEKVQSAEFKRGRHQERIRQLDGFFHNFLQSAIDDDLCLTTVTIEAMKIMKTVVEKMRKKTEKKTCPICLEDMTENIVILQCGHRFHKTCQETWLQTSLTCSVCRGTISQAPLIPCNGCVGDVLRMPVKNLHRAMKMPQEVVHRKIHDDIMKHYLYFFK